MGRCYWLVGISGIVALLGCWLGCARREPLPPQPEVASLPYLQQTHHPELRAELARLLAEDATPQLLEQSAYGGLSSKAPPLPAERADREPNEIVDTQSLRLALQRLSRFYPAGRLQLSGVDLQKGRELRERFGPQLDGYRAVFQRDDYQFHISLLDGLMADLTVLDHARLAHRLEGLEAAERLATGDPTSALLVLRNMLRIDARLAVVQHVTTRLTAARLRGEALQAVAAIVEHPQCTPLLQRELLTLLQSQLEHWPPDADAWIGDRALGLHAYEMVRSGQLLSLLTEQEIEDLKKRDNLSAFSKAVMMSVDEDEWFYLSTMRRVVESCSQPFFERLATLEAVNDRVEALRNTPRYPLFATRVLLENLGAGQREQALDRARCEAWVIALQTATGNPVSPMWINPVTGKPYELLRDDEAIKVSGIEGHADEPPISVPCR